jgi:hypothetical protein
MFPSSEMACINSPYSCFHGLPIVYLVSIIAATRNNLTIIVAATHIAFEIAFYGRIFSIIHELIF